VIRALLALLMLCGVSAGCSEQTAPPPQQAPKPALWAIEHPSGGAAGWLFGTIHALPDGTQWETPAIARAVDDAGVLVVEVRDLDPARMAATLDALALDDPGPPLAERLTPVPRRALAELLERKGKPAGAYDDLESWAAALALSRLAGTVPVANGVDKALTRRFAARPIAELEGAAAQLTIFDRLPERTQRAMLAAVIAEQDDPAADARALAQAWLAGDMALIERTARRGLLADPALYRALAVDRNRAWIQAIVPMIEDGRRPLVAVGTVHMVGPEGLPALLAAQGYPVRRVQ
jgi:uncharacterized protein YbaP (TraB family)